MRGDIFSLKITDIRLVIFYQTLKTTSASKFATSNNGVVLTHLRFNQNMFFVPQHPELSYYQWVFLKISDVFTTIN